MYCVSSDSVGVRGHREQHHAAHGNLVLVEIDSKAGNAAGPEILPREEQRRITSIIGSEEAAHELRQRRHVPGSVPESRAMRRLVGAAVRGAHRVDEDEVGLREQRAGIVGPLIRRISGGAVAGPLHALRAEAAELLPGGRNSRCAAEEE
jgi:hypothetical protein